MPTRKQISDRITRLEDAAPEELTPSGRKLVATIRACETFEEACQVEDIFRAIDNGVPVEELPEADLELWRELWIRAGN